MPQNKQQGFSAILVVILMIVLAALVMGGIYFYFMYLPAQYAKESVSIMEGVFEQGQDSSSINQKDYKIALETLVKRQGVLESARDRLNKFKLIPPKMKQFHEDNIWYLQAILDANKEAQDKAWFLADLFEIYLIFKPEKLPFDVNTAQVSDYQKYYQDQIPRAKSLGDQIFEREEVMLEGVSFKQLQNSWQEVDSGLDLILENILAQDPNQPLSGYASIPPTSEQQEAIDKLREFGRLADDAFSKNNASDILAYRSYTGQYQEGLNERTQRIETALDDLKKRYSINTP